MLDRLVEAGNTVVVIEHNLDVVKTADWIIDLGPEGGDGGGRLVAEGTPEQVAKVKGSYTGRYLAPLLAPRRRRARRKVAVGVGHREADRPRRVRRRTLADASPGPPKATRATGPATRAPSSTG